MILYTSNANKYCGHRNKIEHKEKCNNWGGGDYFNFLSTTTFSYNIFLNCTCVLINAVNLYKYGTVLQEA